MYSNKNGDNYLYDPLLYSCCTYTGWVLIVYILSNICFFRPKGSWNRHNNSFWRKSELSSLHVLFKSLKSAHASLSYTDFFESALFQIPSTDAIASKLNPNTFVGLVGKVRIKLSPEGGRKGGWRKKARTAPAGSGARTRDLPRARRGSGAARQGGCLDKQAFPCL